MKMKTATKWPFTQLLAQMCAVSSMLVIAAVIFYSR
jgi:hypothetical protein